MNCERTGLEEEKVMDKVMPVRDVFARIILDPRGYPAVETEVLAGENTVGKATASMGSRGSSSCAVPSASEETVCGEAAEWEKCMEEAERVSDYINSTAAEALIGKNVFDQETVDRIISMSGERVRTGIQSGCRGLLALSLASARVAAQVSAIPLFRYLGGIKVKKMPLPLVTLIDECPECGRWLLAPIREQADGEQQGTVQSGKYTDGLRDNLYMCAKIYHAVGKMIREREFYTGIGDSGGWILPVAEREKTVRILEQSVRNAGYQTGRDVMTAEVSGQKQRERERGITKQTGLPNTVLIDVCRADTLTELMEQVRRVRQEGYCAAVGSSRPMTDPFSADLAVACEADMIWAGAPCRGENLAVYNQLLVIEEQI